LSADDSNGRRIETRDSYTAFVEARGGRARNRRRQQRQRGTASRPPTAEREVDRMLREWLAEANAHLRLAHTLGDSVVALGHFARAFGRETNKTVLANVARAWRGD
jgi:hypothetical protein